jgi:arginyl-tRNA synthetase
MKGIYKKLPSILEKILKKEYKVEINPPLWELPSQDKFGDISTTVALKVASLVKKNPSEVAERIKKNLEKYLKKEIEKVEIVSPGFVNLFFSKNFLLNSLNQILRKKEKFFQVKIRRKVLLEFVSANPTGPLSVAHGRQAVVGDVIASVLNFFGNKVVKEYYINDVGRQIELLAESVKARIRELEGKEVIFPEDGYQGEYIKEVAKKYLEERSPQDLKKFSLNYLLSLIKKDLDALGVKFDSWISQNKLIQEKKVDKVINDLRKKRFIYEKDGALWFSSTKFGDDKDRVILKNDQEYTYFASDIAYHREKIERGFDLLINLWGPDHHGYIERVKASLKAQGFRDDILKVIIIQLVKIKSKEKMSKRKGNIVLLSQLLELIGKEATRFYYLIRRNSSHLDFDIELATTSSFENPLYYIQYACARIESIFRKSKTRKIFPSFSKFLRDEEELMLLRKILQFFYCLQKVYYSLEPVFIIEYLKDLASCFHKFYERKRVLEEKKEKMYARLNLLAATKIVLHCGLKLLGIEPKERM